MHKFQINDIVEYKGGMSVDNPAHIREVLEHVGKTYYKITDVCGYDWEFPIKEEELLFYGPTLKNIFIESIMTNEQGGKNSDIKARFDLLPPLAIKELAKVLEEGSKKYEEWNWLKVTKDEHVNHALGHIFNFLSPGYNDWYISSSDPLDQKQHGGPKQIEELSHAFCRIGMALELLLRRKI